MHRSALVRCRQRLGLERVPTGVGREGRNITILDAEPRQLERVGNSLYHLPEPLVREPEDEIHLHRVSDADRSSNARREVVKLNLLLNRRKRLLTSTLRRIHEKPTAGIADGLEGFSVEGLRSRAGGQLPRDVDMPAL